MKAGTNMSIKNFCQNIILLLTSSLIVLLFSELLSRVYFEQAYTHTLDEHGNITSMQLNPGHPELGLIPSFRGRMKSGEFDIEIILDSLGFRSPIITQREESTRPLYVTLLGDSFMFGWGVERDSSYAGHLARELSRKYKRSVVITNLSVPGTGQATQLRLLRNIPHPKPDIIIASLYLADHAASGNDLLDNLNDHYDRLDVEHSVDSGEKTLGNVGLLRNLRRALKKHSNLYRVIEARVGALVISKLSSAMSVQRDEQIMQKAWQITESLLVELHHEAEERGALFAIQYVPNMLDVIRLNEQVYSKLRTTAGRENMLLAPNPMHIFRTVTAAFSLDMFYFLVDGHWTKTAHRVCAESMSDLIIDELNRPTTC